MASLRCQRTCAEVSRNLGSACLATVSHGYWSDRGAEAASRGRGVGGRARGAGGAGLRLRARRSPRPRAGGAGDRRDRRDRRAAAGAPAARPAAAAARRRRPRRAAPAAAAPRGPGPGRRAARRDELSTGARAAIETAPPAGAIDPGAAPPARSAWFDLRRGRGPAVDLRLPQGRRDVDYVPRGTDADPGVPPTGQLQESGGGSHRSDQGPFTAKVAPDGSVTLKDRRNFQFGIRPPTPRSIAKGVTQWYDSDKGPDGQRGERTLEKEVGGSTDAGDRSKAVIVPVVRGSFDLTDAFMRGKGHDPYASKKLAFLDSTRDERVQIGTKHREQQLLLTPQIVRRNLDRAWQRAGDARARTRGAVRALGRGRRGRRREGRRGRPRGAQARRRLHPRAAPRGRPRRVPRRRARRAEPAPAVEGPLRAV